MNEILSLQQRIQDTSREYDHEYNQIQELEEVYMQLQRKISFHDEEIKKLREKIQDYTKIDLQEKEELYQLILERKSLELSYESVQNRLNYLPEYLSNKLVSTHLSITKSTENLEQLLILNDIEELETEKHNLEKMKKDCNEEYEIEIQILESQLKEVEIQIEDEEQTLALIQACLEGVQKRNELAKLSSESKQKNSEYPSSFPEYEHYEEEKASSSQVRDDYHDEPLQHSQYQQPWFRMVKRRKMTNEYLTTSNREFKSATEIIYEKEQEWTEVSYP